MTKHQKIESETTVADQLSSFASAVSYADIPIVVRERARYLVLDAIGIALASTQFDFAHRTLNALREFGSGTSDVIGYGAKLPLRDAVMINGLLIHGLDYDDTHMRGVIHATSSCFPTALGMAASVGASGRDLLTAYIAGIEIATRLGSVAKGGFHQTGFHPTGLIGAFACALVAGRLKGLTRKQLSNAQGIALSFASGSLEFLQDGAWTKRIHPGWAGAAGITAATLARNGFVGPKAVYEGRFGLFASHLGPLAEQCDLDLATDALGLEWEVAKVAVKPIPACHFVHSCTDAAAALRSKHGIEPGAIEKVRALIPAEVVKTVCEPVGQKKRPQNSYDAQFSIPFAVATALVKGRFSLADLDSDALANEEVLQLAQRVDYEVDPNSVFPASYSGEVIISLRDGNEVSQREQVNRGALDRPLSAADIDAKFADNASMALAPSMVDRIREAVLGMDDGITALELSSTLSGNR